MNNNNPLGRPEPFWSMTALLCSHFVPLGATLLKEDSIVNLSSCSGRSEFHFSDGEVVSVPWRFNDSEVIYGDAAFSGDETIPRLK